MTRNTTPEPSSDDQTKLEKLATPFADLLPAPSTDERDALKTRIEAEGMACIQREDRMDTANSSFDWGHFNARFGSDVPLHTANYAEPRSWSEVCEIETGLLHLDEQAVFLGRSRRGRNRHVTLERLKRQFSRSAGWTAQSPSMRGSGVIELCSRRLLAANEPV